MDGRQGKIAQSLQFRLSAWLSIAIFGFALVAGAWSFMKAFSDANELQDDQLRQIAALVHRGPLPVSPVAASEPVAIADADSRVVVQALHPPGSAAPAASPHALALPADLPDGIQTVSVGSETWRVFVQSLADGPRIAVAQPTAVRDEVARESALRTATPLLILVPVLLLLVGVLVGQMFKPVRQLAGALDERQEEDLGAIEEKHLPAEIVPFVVAINRLLLRVARSVTRQRRFVADAAHELRSPLTALSLQAERLAAADMSGEARERLTTLRGGLLRARVLLDQLLTLARAQNSSGAGAQTVSVQQVFREVLEDLMPLAQAKDIDLGVIDGAEGAATADAGDTRIAATPLDLKTLVRNLLDNAIRYTPTGGRVDLSARSEGGQITLQVVDTGPGIAEGERERVFDPFYRVLGSDEEGSGLGLSIVKTIAMRLGAQLTLADAGGPAESPGLCAKVVFGAHAAR